MKRMKGAAKKNRNKNRNIFCKFLLALETNFIQQENLALIPMSHLYHFVFTYFHIRFFLERSQEQHP